jgi:hypothetical protein
MLLFRKLRILPLLLIPGATPAAQRLKPGATATLPHIMTNLEEILWIAKRNLERPFTRASAESANVSLEQILLEQQQQQQQSSVWVVVVVSLVPPLP